MLRLWTLFLLSGMAVCSVAWAALVLRENGLIPFTGYEEKRVRQMIEDISYNNANNYFNF